MKDGVKKRRPPREKSATNSNNGSAPDQPVVRRLVIEQPDENSPGHLWRLRKAVEIDVVMNDPNTPSLEKLKLFDDMIDMILPFVVEPEDPEEARALLSGPNGLSETEFRQIFGVKRAKPKAEVPPQNGTP